jgi:hypothetical protein
VALQDIEITGILFLAEAVGEGAEGVDCRPDGKSCRVHQPLTMIVESGGGELPSWSPTDEDLWSKCAGGAHRSAGGPAR